MAGGSAETTVLAGGDLADEIKDAAARRAANFTRRAGRPPGLTALLVGGDDGSRRYLEQQRLAADAAGIHAQIEELPASATTAEVVDAVHIHNRDPAKDAILVATPLPVTVEVERVREALAPRKDIDGAHPTNRGKVFTGSLESDAHYVPCTAKAILRLLRHYDVDLAAQRAVVIGRSIIVGRPTAALLLAADATVTVCHSQTVGLAAICRQADILVVAAGVPEMVGSDHVGEGATVVDVGVHERDGALVGDVDFEAVRARAGAVTPVPGGVGALTVAGLLENTVIAAEKGLRGANARRQERQDGASNQ